MKKKNQNIYRKNFRSLWWKEIKAWFGWENWKQILTTGFIFIAMLYLLSKLGRKDLANEEIWLRAAVLSAGAIWFIVICIISFFRVRLGYTDSFELVLNEIEYSHQNERACIFVLVRNKSKHDIENCYLKAKTQAQKDLAPLSWSEINPQSNLEYKHITISPGEEWRSDIIVAWKKTENAVLCVFPQSEGDRIILPGTHKITISAYGRINGNEIEHGEEFTMVYQGSNKLAFYR